MSKTSSSNTSTQAITPELRQWIVAQAEAGCRPEDVLAAMVKSGWDEDVAVDAMEHTLRARLEQVAPRGADGQPLGVQPFNAAVLKVAAAGAASGAAAGAASTAATGAAAAATDLAGALPAAVPVPWVAYDEALGPVLDVDGHAVQVLAKMDHPRVLVLGGLLSDAECDAIIALSRAKLERSQTIETATGGSEVNEARTSEGMFFERGAGEVISRVEQRIATLLHWPVLNGEGLQILRYRPGAEYKPHHDYFDPVHSGTPVILKRGGQRVGTLVMYLNTPEGGGATTFPDVGFMVAPVKGNAVFFSYDRAHPSTQTLHGGAPVTAGEKWVATKWLREGEFH